jgi:DNA-directed RNA polymerase subunit RPC12/RpoP
MKTIKDRPILKPSQVWRLTKAGKMPVSVPGGRYRCKKCERLLPLSDTESPNFHENGSYVYCKYCKEHVLYVAEFPACDCYPKGFVIDVSGERKKYPLTVRSDS